jgi:hypothetical protein
MISYTDKLTAVQGWVYSKRLWLESFSGPKSKFPRSIIEEKQRDLTMLEAIASDYERAVSKERNAA